MKAPSHFFPGASMSFADLAATALLAPLGLVYGFIATARMKQKGRAAPVPVLCIGNPLVGGAGKTPTALALAALLKRQGGNPVFLSRGYGGRHKNPHRVDPAHDTAGDVGDEALILSEDFPAIVAADRVAGATLAARYGDIIIMDDGFQNPSLDKAMALLVVDRAQGLGNGMPLPAGPLRAFLGPQIARADALLLVGEEGTNRAMPAVREAARRGKPVLSARFEVTLPDMCRSRPLIAFTGIGRPEKFMASVTNAGGAVIAFRPFGDHHRYSEADAARLLGEAESAGALLVTTHKDAVKLRGGPELDRLGREAIVVHGTMRFEDEARVAQLIAPLVKKAG